MNTCTIILGSTYLSSNVIYISNASFTDFHFSFSRSLSLSYLLTVPQPPSYFSFSFIFLSFLVPNRPNIVLQLIQWEIPEVQTNINDWHLPKPILLCHRCNLNVVLFITNRISVHFNFIIKIYWLPLFTAFRLRKKDLKLNFQVRFQITYPVHNVFYYLSLTFRFSPVNDM